MSRFCDGRMSIWRAANCTSGLRRPGGNKLFRSPNPCFGSFLDIAGSDDPRAPLFPRAFAGRQRNVPTGALSNQFYRLMTKAGVVPARNNKATGKGRSAARTSNGLGFHCLRHTVPTLLKQSGKAVQAPDATTRVKDFFRAVKRAVEEEDNPHPLSPYRSPKGVTMGIYFNWVRTGRHNITKKLL